MAIIQYAIDRQGINANCFDLPRSMTPRPISELMINNQLNQTIGRINHNNKITGVSPDPSLLSRLSMVHTTNIMPKPNNFKKSVWV
jgi:hypothetical protein